MDPIAALGIAANVAQFVQFAGALMGQGWALYKDGNITTDLDLALVISDLHDISRQIATSTFPSGNERSLSKEENSLKKLCERSTELSTELLLVLNDLSVGSPGQKWQSLRQAIRPWESEENLTPLRGHLAIFESR